MKVVYAKASKVLVHWARHNYEGQYDVLYAIASVGGIECTTCDILRNKRRLEGATEGVPMYIKNALKALIRRLDRCQSSV